MACFFCGVSYGLFFSVFFTEEMAMAMVPMVLIPFMLFGGYFVNQSNVPYYFYPLQYMSMFKYGFQAAVEVKKTVFYMSTLILYRMNSETLFIIVMLRRHQSVTLWNKEIMERISTKVALFDCTWDCIEIPGILLNENGCHTEKTRTQIGLILKIS